jgi:hypothetical protein
VKNKEIKNSTELVQHIINVEKEIGLLDQKSENYSWEWAAHRMEFYYLIAKEAGILDQAHDDSNTVSNFGGFLRTLKYTIRSPFVSFQRGTTVVIPHKRKVLYKGKMQDLNSLFVQNEIQQNEEVEVWDLPYNNEHKIKGRDIYYLDLISIAGRIGSIFGNLYVNKRVTSLANIIEEKLQIKVDLIKHISRASAQFRVKKFLFKLLLKIKAIKEIYVVIAYGHTALIEAAKELSIPVIELQHGVINKFHFGYHYPHVSKSDYFPDQLWVWHEMWKNSAYFPVSDPKIKVNKNNHLERFKQKCSSVNEENSVLIISQGTIGKELSDYILKNCNNLNSFKIYYKLHPGEFKSSENYKSLIELSKQSNVEIIKDEMSIYDLFARVKVVIGVYSTALYEAHYFEKNIYIAPITGSEYMREFLKEEKVEMYNSQIEI